MDLSRMMEMANQLRQHVEKAQSEAANVRVAGEAGAGLVQVVMNGKHEVVEVKIDPKALQSQDAALLSDLVRAACNSASSKVAAAMQDNLMKMAQEFGVDPSALDMLQPK